MNIGIDIDGVLIDIGQFLRDNGTKYFKDKYDLSIVDPSAYAAEDLFGCTYQQSRKFWLSYGVQYWVSEPCIEGCAEVISRLREEGHMIHLITSRIITANRGPVPWFLRYMLKYWLKTHEIYYDEIVFCPEKESAPEKLAACKRHHIDVMIDDTPANLLAIKDSISAVCYDSPWNADLHDENIRRVYSWSEIYDVISEMEQTMAAPKQTQ